MKLISLLGCLLITLHSACAEGYREEIRKASDRYDQLEMERCDYRKSAPTLSPEKELERQALLGKLTAMAPLWTLQNRLSDDLLACGDAVNASAEALTRMENLKDLLALTTQLKTPATQKEAEQLATEFRKFIVLNDVAGARAWATKHSF